MGEITDENWDEKVFELAGKSKEEEDSEYRQLREAFMKKLVLKIFDVVPIYPFLFMFQFACS